MLATYAIIILIDGNLPLKLSEIVFHVVKI